LFNLVGVLPPAVEDTGVHAPGDVSDLVVVQQAGHDDEREPELLEVDAALVVLNLGSPAEEVADVLGHLGDGRGGAVLVLDQAVGERRGHGEDAALEVRVPELAGLQGRHPVGDAEGVFPVVAGEQREDVVDTTKGDVLADTEGDGAEIRRLGAVVGELGGLGVGVGEGKPVGGLALAEVELALRVGDGVHDLLLGGELLDLLLGHEGLEVVEGQALEGMARREDLGVDLAAAADGVPVHTGEAGVVAGIVLDPVPFAMNGMSLVSTHFFFFFFDVKKKIRNNFLHTLFFFQFVFFFI
jgi:hypothetical protein